ncbi:uncharacterized protein LOC123811322 [Phyllostomus hastatus]|uniref:uncharacterized protein LOC123811322 n=1 Tax=Phyllostomus hastatus TaxID=9423 RepID=UPI001E67E932|nr:uncharacterized protein LOC123811322 [Phyllostomus hastatus]
MTQYATFDPKQLCNFKLYLRSGDDDMYSEGGEGGAVTGTPGAAITSPTRAETGTFPSRSVILRTVPSEGPLRLKGSLGNLGPQRLPRPNGLREHSWFRRRNRETGGTPRLTAALEKSRRELGQEASRIRLRGKWGEPGSPVQKEERRPRVLGPKNRKTEAQVPIRRSSRNPGRTRTTKRRLGGCQNSWGRGRWQDRGRFTRSFQTVRGPRETRCFRPTSVPPAPTAKPGVSGARSPHHREARPVGIRIRPWESARRQALAWMAPRAATRMRGGELRGPGPLTRTGDRTALLRALRCKAPTHERVPEVAASASE